MASAVSFVLVEINIKVPVGCNALHRVRLLFVIVIDPIWHHGLIKAQAESLEAIQRRALRIIDSTTVGLTRSHLALPSSPLSTTAENT